MPDVNVSPSFQSPPSTAAMFKNSYTASPAGQAAQQVAQPDPVAQPQTAPQPQQVTVPPARVANPILPAANPQANAQPQVAQPSVTGSPEATQPVPPPAAHFQGEAALQRQLEMERQAWANERQQWQNAMIAQNEQLQATANAMQEYQQMKQQQALQQQLANDEAFSDIVSIDADEARKLIQLTSQTLQAPMTAMQQELQKQQAAMQQQQQYVNQQLYRMQQQQSVAKLQAAHPDFQELAKNPAFVQFAQQREGFTSKTREQVAWEEFNAGNPDYVINMVNQFKGVAPTVETMRTVPPVQTANTVATTGQTQKAAPQFTLTELNNLMQMRQITPEEYRVYLNQIRAAQNGQTP